MLSIQTKYKGFTLLELLVVIVIIGILATLIAGTFSGSQQQARDTQRRNDLTHYQKVLQNYAVKSNGTYPVAVSATDLDTTICATLNTLLEPNANCPVDPNVAGNYLYLSNLTGTQYLVYALLEENNSGLYVYYCSSGATGTIATIPALATCQ